MKKFTYITRSCVLRDAKLHPTKGWKTSRIKDLSKSLKGLDFDFDDMLKKLNSRSTERIYCDRVNPMIGMKS